jgi:hypothetical protein
MTYLFPIIASVAPLAGLCYWGITGFRNGDRPTDARVTAVFGAGAPGRPRPVVVAVISNPAGTPVLAALRARRALLPGWLADPHVVGVPRWTVRRTFRASRYAVVGVVPAGAAMRLRVPVPVPVAGHALRGCRLTVAVGQEGGRLRVHTLRVAGTPGVSGRRKSIMYAH